MSDKITCVFVHGWAMNSGVWSEIVSMLPNWIEAVRVDLPGHGLMAEHTANNLDDYVDVLSSTVRLPSIWVGWSLGGLVILRLADKYPEKVSKLFMVATTPCFVRNKNWNNGIEEEVFLQFADELRKDVDQTIKKFIALQAYGSESQKTTVKKLLNSIKERGLSSADKLNIGLNILLETDLTNIYRSLKKPVTWVLGEKDNLVPVKVKQQLEDINSSCEVNVIQKAGHAPFISHPDEFMKILIRNAETK